jgi:hypothetical protein
MTVRIGDIAIKMLTMNNRTICNDVGKINVNINMISILI